MLRTFKYRNEQSQTLLTDEKLMQRLQEGDHRCFDILYDRYSTRLLRYLVRMMGGDMSRAQDLLQDVFLAVIDKAAQFKNGYRFSGWVYVIAHNRCKNEYRFMDYRRKDQNVAPEDHEQSAVSADQRIDRKAFRQNLERALKDLSPEKRSMFLLRFEEELSLKEIARIFDMPVGTVKSRLHYVLRYLNSQLQDYNPQKTE